MNAGAEEGFIGVDISNAAHEGLVQQQALDARLMPPEGGGEFVEGDFQRFGPEAGNAAREVFAELDRAELAAVVEQQGGAVEGEDGVGMFAGIGAQQEAAGHAEVDRQIAAAPDGGPEKLPVALDRKAAAALQAGGEPGGIAAAEDAEVAKLGAEHALARDGGQRADHGFDFGELDRKSTRLNS